MTDYSELKRLAEACENHNWRFLTEKLTEYGIRDDHGYIAFLPVEHPAKYGACPAREAKARFLGAMTPAAVLALIAENERLKKFEEWFGRLETCNNSLAESFRAERDQLKAENDRLRKLPTCWSEVLEQSEANDELLDKVLELGADAERYRWLRSQHWNESDMVVACHPKKSVKLGFDCPSGERLDHAIDAAMSKGEQV